MKMRIWVLALGALLLLAGCGSQSKADRLPEGTTAWLGQGVFTSSHGQMDVRAQLELDEAGTYRLLYLEPAPLTMMGLEEGQWSEQEGQVYLQPMVQQADENSGLFDRMSAANSQNSQPKTLNGTVGSGELTFQDAKLTLTYQKER